MNLEKRLTRTAALAVSLSLVLTSPGFAAYRAAGEVVTGAGKVVTTPALNLPKVDLPLSGALNVPALNAPSIQQVAIPGVQAAIPGLQAAPTALTATAQAPGATLTVPQAENVQPGALQAVTQAAETAIQVQQNGGAYSNDSAASSIDFASGLKRSEGSLQTPAAVAAGGQTASNRSGLGHRTTAKGQLKGAAAAGIVSAGLFGLAHAIGGETLSEKVAQYSTVVFASFAALASTAYTLLGLRLLNAAWKAQPTEGSAGAKLSAALDATAATPEGRSAHIETQPARVLAVVDHHEAAHRGGSGEVGAYASQLSVFPKFLAGEVLAIPRGIASVFRRAGSAIASAAATAREMAFGDKKLEKHMASERGSLRLVRGLFVADAVLGIAIGFLIGPLLDTAQAASVAGLGAHLKTLGMYSGLLVAAFMAYTFVERTHVFVKRSLTLRATRSFRVALKRALVGQEMDFHLENGSAALASRVRDDTNYLTLKNIDVPLEVLIYGLYFVGGVSMMLLTHAGLSVLVLAAIPVLGFLTGRIGQKLVDVSFESGNAKAELTRHAQEVLQQAQTVKAFAAHNSEVERYADKAAGVKDLGIREAKLNADYGLVTSLKDFFTKNLVYVLGAWVLGLSMGMTFGQLTQMTLFAGFASSGLGGLFSAYMMFKKYSGNSKVVADLLERQPAIQDAPDAKQVQTVRGEVRFENVDFSYPNRPAAGKVLNGLDLTVEPGQTVALVGETGSGKSTVAKLVLRLWEPTSGRVTIDGEDLKTLDRRALLSRVAVVPQDTRLFSGSIRDNMIYGTDNVTDEQLTAAIKMAAAEFVFDAERFPNGLKTSVAEGGGRLSGGERQRVAIVRALLRNPSLLILDEATSALDNESEKVVQGALDRLVQGEGGKKPSTIVVAHRLSTIRNADKIVVLEKGKVAEMGTHDELLALGGRYAKLWKQGTSKPEPKASAGGQLAAAGVAFGLTGAGVTLAVSGAGLLAAITGAVVAAAAFVPGLAFLVAGVRMARAVAKHLKTIEAAGPRGPGSRIGRFFKSLAFAVATPSTRSEVFSKLPRRIRLFIDAHEAAHKDRGVGELGAHAAQLSKVWYVLKKEWKAFFIPLGRFGRSLKTMIVGDEVVAPVLKPHKGMLRAAVAFLLAESVLAVAGSNLTGRLLDAAQEVAKSGDVTTLKILSAVVAAVLLGHAAVKRYGVRLAGTLKSSLTKDLRVALFGKLLGSEMSFLMKEESGALASRLADDAEALSGKNTSVRLPLLQHALFLVLSIGFLASISVSAALIIMAVLPIIGTINGMFGQKSERNYVTFSQRRAELGRSAQETFEHIQTVKTFGREKEAVEQYAGRAQALVDTGVEGAKIMANSHMFSSSITDFFTRYLIYIAGAWVLAATAGFTLGQIAAMTFYAGFIKAAFDGLAAGWLEFKQAHGETKVLREWLTRKPKIQDAPGALPLEPGPGEVTFEDVKFSYGDETGGEPVLKGVSFTAKPGQTVAFVGGSGSGKSTIMKVLQRLWEPQEGAVKIDGADVRGVTMESVAKSIAVVPQDTRLFDDTIRFNMTYGGDDVSDDRLAAAVKMARAEFINDKNAFPQGLDTKVGEGGAKLSGGQRQRVAIVRAILKGARILILDEATSALDKQTEREIQETLDSLTTSGGLGKPTTLVVAHNLTTTMNADKIVVMEKGRVVETGTHAELLAKGGAYTRLWDASQKEK